MTCFEAAVAFIYRLDVPSELKSEAASAYKAYDEQLAAAGLKRNCSRAKLPICSKEDDSDAHQAKLYPISSNGNLSGMVDEDGVLRVSAGHANQVERLKFMFKHRYAYLWSCCL